MGSFRIIAFIGLVFFTGILSIISILIRSALTDTTNILISQNMLSVDTVNTVNTILGITQWAGVIAIIALAVWALSGVVNDSQESDN